MIEFQTEPDPIFLAILTEALEWLLIELNPYAESYTPTPQEVVDLDEQYQKWQHELLVRFFTRDEARVQLAQLLRALRDQSLYRITDYHWLILYVALNVFTDLHNDDDLGRHGRVGPYTIDEIDFDYILDVFFFDTDFLFGPELLVEHPTKLEVVPGVTPQARKIAAGIKPDPDDLELTAIESNRSEMKKLPRQPGTYPTSGYVGPYPMRERNNEVTTP